jgi:hypothetical protein
MTQMAADRDPRAYSPRCTDGWVIFSWKLRAGEHSFSICALCVICGLNRFEVNTIEEIHR